MPHRRSLRAWPLLLIAGACLSAGCAREPETDPSLDVAGADAGTLPRPEARAGSVTGMPRPGRANDNAPIAPSGAEAYALSDDGAVDEGVEYGAAATGESGNAGDGAAAPAPDEDGDAAAIAAAAAAEATAPRAPAEAPLPPPPPEPPEAVVVPVKRPAPPPEQPAELPAPPPPAPLQPPPGETPAAQ